MLNTQLRKHFDWPLLLLVYLLACIGVLIIFSATRGDAAATFHKKQIIWVILGTAGLALTSTLDYHLYTRVARHLYWINLVLLLLVKLKGHATNGAARWIRIGAFQFQPSEFAKLFIILTLGAYLARRHEEIKEFKTLALSFFYISVPTVLILRQPDLGTALVVIAIWFGMVYMAGARLKHLGAFFAAGLALFGLLLATGKINKYQRDRLQTFQAQIMGRESAGAKKEGYHVAQARIAIGSGGLWGKGFLHSTQVRGGYIPEKQTDFIFTTIGEELGFAGAFLITILYGGLLWRGTQIIAAADEDVLGKLIATGVVTMLAFHVIVNIGMNIGIVPVTGVPLPLISSGGSSMLLTLATIGLLQSIARHRHQLLF